MQLSSKYLSMQLDFAFLLAWKEKESESSENRVKKSISRLIWCLAEHNMVQL